MQRYTLPQNVTPNVAYYRNIVTERSIGNTDYSNTWGDAARFYLSPFL